MKQNAQGNKMSQGLQDFLVDCVFGAFVLIALFFGGEWAINYALANLSAFQIVLILFVAPVIVGLLGLFADLIHMVWWITMAFVTLVMELGLRAVDWVFETTYLDKWNAWLAVPEDPEEASV